MISCVISDGVLFGAPSSASSRFIEKIRTKYSKSDSNLQEAAEALKRKPAPLCLQEPELLEVMCVCVMLEMHEIPPRMDHLTIIRIYENL